MDLEFFWDEAGDPRARSDKEDDPVVSFLESDVQGSDVYAREVLAAIDEIAAGDRESWERTGNAYTLALSRRRAKITPEFEEEAEPRRLPLLDFRDAVRGWLDFLESARQEG